MSGEQDNSPLVRSWRDIPQEVKPRAMSKTGRRRYMLAIAKVVSGTCFLGLLAWGGIDLFTTIENHPRQLAEAAQVGPLRDITLSTDGVLTKAWVERTLGIAKGTTLMELDLPKLQARLVASGQVRSVILAKKFPTTLSVILAERSPVTRVMVQENDQTQQVYLVARDGVVYKGEDYDATLMDSLPWLDGVRLSRKGGVFAPVEGMEVVADLISKAKYETVHLYSLFQVINLARLQSDGEIEIRSPECESVVFSTSDDFFRQLAWLDSIRDMVKPSVEMPLAKVDLSHGRNVPVSFRPIVPASATVKKPAAAAATAAATPAPEPYPAFPDFFNSQRKPTKREL